MPKRLDGILLLGCKIAHLLPLVGLVYKPPTHFQYMIYTKTKAPFDSKFSEMHVLCMWLLFLKYYGNTQVSWKAPYGGLSFTIQIE